jgi:hypothetical protein
MPYIPKNVGEVTEIKAFISQGGNTAPVKAATGWYLTIAVNLRTIPGGGT